MIRFQFNNGSAHRVILPLKQQKQETITLAQAFMQYENSLPSEDQTPFTADIGTALSTALAAQATSVTQEISRKTASETLKRLDATARSTVGQIRNLLEGRFANTPELAQAWGFFVRQTGRGAGNILTPRGRDDIITCLSQYIANEQARPVAEQFSQPLLADVITLRDDLVQQRQQRDQARQERLSQHTSLEAACEALAKKLRLALAYLILTHYDGEPNRDLAHWGFELVARTPQRDADEERPSTPEPEEDPLPEGVELVLG